MCLILLAIHQHPNYPLILAANRDEYHARPSAPMQYWDEQPHILAGRDWLHGGTWFGVNRRGNFCAVTNFRTGQPPSPSARSRGELVARYLESAWQHEQDSTAEFVAYLQQHCTRYNPFNLVFGNAEAVWVFGRRERAVRPLSAGYHAVSNARLDEYWPKMTRGVTLLRAQTQTLPTATIKPAALITSLQSLMRDPQLADDAMLPNTGIGHAAEKRLSPIFITGSEYGTRTTSCLVATPAAYEVHEINYDVQGEVAGRCGYAATVVSGDADHS